ncbi:MAG: SEC-C metal-binding domain-containing protein [Planctomycetota bacterium]|nr:SEC-C metal-binding domain-containing protein [Planctomycetota bacterium]
MTEWIREHLGVEIDPDRLKGKDRVDLHRLVQREAKEEAGTIIDITLPEFLSRDIDLGKGKTVERDEHGDDYQGLVDWANSHFKAGLKVSDIHEMNSAQIARVLNMAAEDLVEATDLDPLDPFLLPEHAKEEFARWISSKFGVEWDASIFNEVEEPEEAAAVVIDKAHELYAEREIVYPVEFAMDMTTAMLQQDPAKALTQFCSWASSRYELDWTPESLPSGNPAEIREALLKEARTWDDQKRAQRVDRILAEAHDVDTLDTWCREHLGASPTDDERTLAEEDLREAARAKLDSALRLEMLQFERWVLLQIVDGAWKDHLHSMDQLRESIGYRSFSQRDPRIEYKREGANLFEEMHGEIRDKVTDLIFKARLQPQVRPPQAPAGQQPPPGGQQPPAGGRPPAQQARPPQERTEAESAVAAAAAAVSVGSRQQQEDLDAAQSAGAPSGAKGASPKRAPVKAKVTVGRNEPCPCGSGKKFKKCCGAN